MRDRAEGDFKTCDIGKFLEQAKPPRPVHGGARVVNAAFNGAVRRFIFYLPSHGRKDAEFRAIDAHVSGDRQRKGARPEGNFCRAAMAEERGLLIDEAGGHGSFSRLAKVARRRSDFGQAFDGHAEELAEFGIPVAGVERHEAGARGGGHIGGKGSGEAIKEEGIAGAEAKAALLEKGAGLVNMVKEPAQLACGKIGVKRQAGAGPGQFLGPIGLQFFRYVLGAVVLPDDGVVDGLAGACIPGNDCFALVVHADGIDLACGLEAGADIAQQFFRVVLDPAGIRVNLLVFEGGNGFKAARIHQG